MVHKTPLYEAHKSLGAKMIEFGPWMMPVQYTGIVQEHTWTREDVSLFDTCHMGEIFVRGEQAFADIETLVPRDLSKSQDGRCYYTHLCAADGGIIDDVIIYRLSDQEFMFVVNGGTIEEDFEWISQHIGRTSTVVNESPSWAKIDVQGPLSLTLLNQVWGENQELLDLPYFSFIKTSIEGHPAIVSRTGYTGELGYELYVHSDFAMKVWAQLIDAGAHPAGLGARDTLRLEMGYPLMGEDLGSDINPIEAGFSFWVSPEKTFQGDSILKEEQKKWKIALRLAKGGIARHGNEIRLNGDLIGHVSSGTWSPSLQQAIAIAYVNQDLKVGTQVDVDVRGRNVIADISNAPFLPETSVKNNVVQRSENYVRSSS